MRTKLSRIAEISQGKVTLGLILAVIPFLFLTVTTPPNMDEFIYYQNISCHYYPNAVFHKFIEGCGSYDITTLGYRWPGMTYFYTGASPSLLYFPIFLLSKHYYAARFTGFLSLTVLYLTIRRFIRGSSLGMVLLVFWFFPLIAQEVVDTGPISLHIACAVLIPYLLAKANSWRSAVLAGILCTFALWHKFIFVATAPGMLAIYAVLFFEDLPPRTWQHLRSQAKYIAICILVQIVPMSIYLSSQNNGGTRIFDALANQSKRISPLAFHQLAQHFEKEFLRYFANHLNLLNRVYGNMGDLNPATIISSLLIVLLLGYGVTSRNRSGLVIALCTLGFLGSIFYLLTISATWAGHHIVLAFPPLIVGCCFAFRKLESHRKNWASLFALAWMAVCATLMIQSSHLTPADHSSWDRLVIAEELSRPAISKDYIYVVTDWGMYYFLALYGNRDQTVLYLYMESKNDVAAVKETALATHKKIAFVKLISSPATKLIKQYFAPLKEFRSNDGRHNEKWEILYES